MDTANLTKLVQNIVKKSCKLKDKYTDEHTAPVNYACIFSQNQDEFETLIKLTNKIGKIIQETPTGPLFKIQPIKTTSGNLKLLKIRNPDETRPERGDADFTLSNYSKFKKIHLQEDGFRLIERPNFEMIELMKSDLNVRAYFSNPPLDKQLDIK